MILTVYLLLQRYLQKWRIKLAFTFANFTSHLKFQFGNRGDLEDVDSVNLYETWVNMAYMNLTTRNRFWALKRNFKFPELIVTDATQSTTDSEAYVNVPSDAIAIYNVQDTTNDVDLDYIKPNKYFGYTDRSDTSAEGEPTEYTRSDDYIFLHPTPDDTYVLEILYRKRPAVLTGTNTTIIGEEWDDAILALAAFIGFSWTHEYDKAKERKDEFMGIVSGIIGIYDIEEKTARDTLHANPMGKDFGFE